MAVGYSGGGVVQHVLPLARVCHVVAHLGDVHCVLHVNPVVGAVPRGLDGVEGRGVDRVGRAGARLDEKDLEGGRERAGSGGEREGGRVGGCTGQPVGRSDDARRRGAQSGFAQGIVCE